jgi:hypothetical protein
MINVWIANLFEVNPQLYNYHFSGSLLPSTRIFSYTSRISEHLADPEVGSIDAVLLPSRILIPNSAATNPLSAILFQIRFQSGTLSDSSGTLKQDLTNWSLSVRGI